MLETDVGTIDDKKVKFYAVLHAICVHLPKVHALAFFFPSMYPAIYPSIYLPIFYLSIYLFIYLPIYLFIHLPTCLPICSSFYLFIYFFLSISPYSSLHTKIECELHLLRYCRTFLLPLALRTCGSILYYVPVVASIDLVFTLTSYFALSHVFVQSSYS